jgi:ribonucleotide reductase alpha subunit
LPIDSLEIVAKSRPERMFEVDRTQRLDWDSLRAKVQKDGMRNSNVMAIAPLQPFQTFVVCLNRLSQHSKTCM